MGMMPYHLEKGHYLLLLEATLNEGIEAVVDDDYGHHLPGLARRYSMLEYMRGVVARPCDPVNGESESGGVLMWPGFMTDADVGFPIFRIIAEDWFGYRIRPTAASTPSRTRTSRPACGTATRATSSGSSPTCSSAASRCRSGSTTTHRCPLPHRRAVGRSTSSSSASSRSSKAGSHGSATASIDEPPGRSR